MVNEHTALTIENLCFAIGDFAWNELNLQLRGREYFVLTGDNGCGKSILIKLICGLLTPSSGQIHIGATALESLPPWERNLGYVPQDGLLFPNRTVRRNVGFGLEVRGVKGQEREHAVDNAMDLLKVSHLADRMPFGLSGGERQRICLARAIVVKPRMLLLDEPVSAIDESSRDALCRDLRVLHDELQTTTLHVSHNSRETSLVADRTGTVANGKIS